MNDDFYYLFNSLNLQDDDNDEKYISLLFPNTDTFKLLSVYKDIEEYDETDIYTEYNLEHPFKVYINHKGIAYYMLNGRSVYKLTNKKTGIFVVDVYYNLYMVSKGFHHSDILSGSDVLCAGEYKLNSKGQIVELNNKSGHYYPDITCLDDVVQIIKQNGYNEKIKLKYYY
jgi:hypothetical protein